MSSPTPPPIVCPGHLRPVVDVHYSSPSADGNVFMISACHDKNPMLRWGDNGDWIGTFAGHKGAVWSACLNRAADRAATGSADFSARFWDAETGENLHTFEHKHVVKAVEFDRGGKRLLTGGLEKKARVFDLEAFDKDPIVMELPSGIRKATWQEGPGTSSQVICGCADGTVRVMDVRTGKTERECNLGTAEVQDLEITKDNSLVTVAAGKSVHFLDATQFSVVKQHNLGINVEAATLHPSGTRFVAGGSDLWVHVVDFESGTELECHKGHHGPVFCLRYAPDGESYASGSEDGTIRIWRTNPSNLDVSKVVVEGGKEQSSGAKVAEE